MKTTYAEWARFDVDAELARVDERETQEQRARADLRRAQAKRGVEDAAAQSSEDAAEILAAQAAVAALKAKRRGRRASRGARAAEKEEGEAVGEDVERLRAQAELLRRKHVLLQSVMSARRDGEALLDENNKVQEALERFERALDGVKTLEKLLPELLEATEREQQVLNQAPAGEDKPEQDDSSRKKDERHQEHQHDHDHNHDGECQHGCNSKQQKTETVKPSALPKPSDLEAVIEMFYKDVYMGIGTCHTRSQRRAAASEAYKEVLIRDGAHLQAWMARGKAFEAMDAPLLAMLHYDRVTALAPSDSEGKAAAKAIKQKVLNAEAAETTDSKSLESYEGSESLSETLATVAELFHEAAVVMTEGFYDYAVSKYKVILDMLKIVKESSNDDNANPETLRKLEVSCHLSIANAFYEMQRDFGVGLVHCNQVLRLEPNHAVCHFRMGQLYRLSHKYEKAIAYLERAQKLAQRALSSQKFLHAINKELDKTLFDRGQYDATYIRSLLSSEKE